MEIAPSCKTGFSFGTPAGSTGGGLTFGTPTTQSAVGSGGLQLGKTSTSTAGGFGFGGGNAGAAIGTGAAPSGMFFPAKIVTICESPEITNK